MEKNLLMHVSAKIRKIRELRGYSQEYMASQLQMSQTNYSKIEKGDTKEMTVERLEKIAKVLEVEPASILSFDEKQVFNSTFNNHAGNHGGNIMFMKDSIEQMKEQYEARIKELKEESTFLKEEVAFLREMLKNKK